MGAPHGQVIEVERNSGTWSRAGIEEYDEGGDTYTVQLLDGTGRYKYFVEVCEIRTLRCGAFVAGRRVQLVSGAARGAAGHVDDFDEETDSYSVRLLDGRLKCYLTADELQEVR